MRNLKPKCRLFVLCIGLYLGGVLDALAVQENQCVGFSAADVPRYEVNCATGAESAGECTVDARTYNGFRIYSDKCATCHGHGTGVSTSPAADLTRRPIKYEDIHFTLYHGHDENLGVMPSWKGNCDVIPRIDELYLYLKARSDGALPLGRPSSE
ncbi:c-type cytochrome [Pseudomonadota bacterium]